MGREGEWRCRRDWERDIQRDIQREEEAKRSSLEGLTPTSVTSLRKGPYDSPQKSLFSQLRNATVEERLSGHV